jgi:hypothetical protein
MKMPPTMPPVFEPRGTWNGRKIGKMTVDGQVGLAVFSSDETNFKFFLEEDSTESNMVKTLDEMSDYVNAETREASEGISGQSHVGEA